MHITTKRGFTLIELMIVIAIIAIIAAIAIPNLKDARKAANEAAAIAWLRTLHTAQNIYREQDKDGNGTLDYAQNPLVLMNVDLIEAESINARTIQDSGYRIGQTYVPVAVATMFTWSFYASPELPMESGDRYFFVDQSGVIRYSVSNLSIDLFKQWPAIGK